MVYYHLIYKHKSFNLVLLHLVLFLLSFEQDPTILQ
nr:MAG TPA: hypothetical protein [Bacteriophage sp.]